MLSSTLGACVGELHIEAAFAAIPDALPDALTGEAVLGYLPVWLFFTPALLPAPPMSLQPSNSVSIGALSGLAPPFILHEVPTLLAPWRRHSVLRLLPDTSVEYPTSGTV